MAQRLKCLPGMQETRVWSLGRDGPLEKEMATNSSTLAWRIPWREEPVRLQSMGSQRVGHDWETSLSLSFCFLIHYPRFWAMDHFSKSQGQQGCSDINLSALQTELVLRPCSPSMLSQHSQWQSQGLSKISKPSPLLPPENIQNTVNSKSIVSELNV